MPFPCLNWYFLTWASSLCCACPGIVDTRAPLKLGCCTSIETRRHQNSCLPYGTSNWIVNCRALCLPSSTAETLSVFLLMHAMSQLPSDIHNTFVNRAGGPRPSFLLHSSMLGFHSSPLLPALGSADARLSPSVCRISPRCQAWSYNISLQSCPCPCTH